MHKRTVLAFVGILVLMMGLIIRVFDIAGEGLSQAADQQQSVTVTVANARGTIYDSRLRPLVNSDMEYRASVTAVPEAIAAISPQLDEAALRELTERLQGNRPAVVVLDKPISPTNGVELFRVSKRYGSYTLSPHLLGYLDGDGLHGVTGIELAFDDYLNEHGGKATVTYKVDAAGRPLQGERTVISNTLDEAQAGVALTLDSDIQRITEAALKEHVSQGAAVVMDPYTGAILSMASLPDFQPYNVADKLERTDSPLLNRALCNYNLGSVFKIVSTATALEQRIPLTTMFSCQGGYTIGTLTLHCHNRLGHGTLDMMDAFAESCNPYFMQLMLQAGGSSLYRMSTLFGFDRAIILAEGFKTARAVLPSEEELFSPAAVANLSFGQGSLLATPVHVAQMVAAVVNGGKIQRPNILKGYVDKEGNLTEQALSPAQTAFSEQTAATLRDMMINVVENGTGNTARPDNGGAGGKTGTAETGMLNEAGKSVVQSWFAGFYPAENPRYAVAVLAEDSGGTGGKSSPVFRDICNELYKLGQTAEGQGTA